MKNETIIHPLFIEHFGDLAMRPVPPEELRAVRQQVAKAARYLGDEQLAKLEKTLREPRPRATRSDAPDAKPVAFESGEIVGTVCEIDTEVETAAEAMVKMVSALFRQVLAWIWEPYTCEDGVPMTAQKAREAKEFVFINYVESRGLTREQIGQAVGLSRDKVIELANDFAEKFPVLAKSSDANTDQVTKGFKAFQEKADADARRHVAGLVNRNWGEMRKVFKTKEDGINAVMNGEYSPADQRRTSV